jgi:hypothetical protein
MNRAVAIGLVVCGIVLLVLGIQASNSLSSDISRFLTGSPTDKAIWMLVPGFFALATGVAILFRGSKR